MRAVTENSANLVARLSNVSATSSGHLNAHKACAHDPRFSIGHRTHGLTPERLALKNIVLVGSGAYHSFAVDKEGQVFAWGLNSFHQTGVAEDDGGWEETITTPTVVEALLPKNHGGARVVQIAGGVHHTMFLFSNGEVWGCGRTDGSEIGLGKDHPAVVEMKEREKEALVRRKAKEVEERERIKNAPVEDDEEGNPGQPLSELEIDLKAQENAAQMVPLPNPYIPIPTKLNFPTEGSDGPVRIIQIATNTRQNFGVSSTGAVYSWGFGNVCQLGLGSDVEEAETPTRVVSKAMNGFRVLSAHAGGQHSVVVAQRGSGAAPSLYKNWAPEEKKEEKEAAAAKEINGEVNGDAKMANGDAEAATTNDKGVEAIDDTANANE